MNWNQTNTTNTMKKNVGILVAIIVAPFQCSVTTLILDFFRLDKLQINKAKLEYLKIINNIQIYTNIPKWYIFYTKYI